MKPFPENVWASNLQETKDPALAEAVHRFDVDLIEGRAVTKVDQNAPPLVIERERRE